MEVPLSTDICRCCLAPGNYKSLKDTFQWMGENENYGDMLKECFNITLCDHDDGCRGGVCELCITQLRNARNFKKQVLKSDQLFKRGLENNFKGEEVKIEFMNDNDIDSDVGNQDEYFVGLETEEEIEVPIKEEISVEVKNRKRQLKVPVKRESLVKKKKAEAETSGKGADGTTTKHKKRKKKNKGDSATPERIEHRVNLTNILRYSNATPFRDKKAKGFSCLYCCKYFTDIEELRVHTDLQSEKDKLNSMNDYKLSYNPIKVDITDLMCTICETEVHDLNDLKEHLVMYHDKKIHRHIKDVILPFRLESGNNFTCVVCSVVHISFKNLYHHMSSHYRNYCCKKCGAGYVTIAALRKHGKTHENGNFPCSFCNKTYTSLAKKKQHEKGVHTGGWLRNKCPHCPEIFVSYYDRNDHLVKVHNETPVLYPCNACEKVYKKKFELNRHIKHHHLQQKNYKCDICNSKFFSKRGLKDHILRHLGGESYTCDVCGKSFSRERTLKEHLRMHEDGKRFQCEVCKKTFAQKCSLKVHIKLHQDDLEIFKEFDDVKHLIDNRDVTLKQIAEENRLKAIEEREARERNTLGNPQIMM
ncbi:Zinc finger protein 778 [Eumeta japonica]|uniref:Zinc finger protein 778 n=1 Tax=Eumeta variegata TaxID=151549 RepID=A0A4C1VUF1_EUMVA|nr:Zinc finger protein 778 [Eumeta japonica]